MVVEVAYKTKQQLFSAVWWHLHRQMLHVPCVADLLMFALRGTEHRKIPMFVFVALILAKIAQLFPSVIVN